MVEKVKIIDVSKCTGCRGCQIACKQWNQLPASQTLNTGTYQNPSDLQANTWTLVRFREVMEENVGVQWLFWKDGCMHCTDATCVKLCPAGARFRTDYGAVGTDNEKCIGCQSCVVACPFGKPRYSEEMQKVYKCSLCADRVRSDLTPACVKACPTGALKFGEKSEMLKVAYRRVEELGGNASVYGDKFFDGTHVIYVLDHKLGFYNSLPAKPKVASSVFFWRELLHPFGEMEASVGLGAAVVLSFFRRRSRIGDRLPRDPG